MILEEVGEVDVILYVVDFVDFNYIGYEKIVKWLLLEFEINYIFIIMLYNKKDELY